MAIHNSIASMLSESLPEMLSVSKYCIEFEKKSDGGCYGYPAALLLLSIVDSIGSYAGHDKNTRDHFNVLNDCKYFNLSLSKDEIDTIFEYRNLLSHNTTLKVGVKLSKGTNNQKIIEKSNGNYKLNLIPLYDLTYNAVDHLLSTLTNENRMIQTIMKK